MFVSEHFKAYCTALPLLVSLCRSKGLEFVISEALGAMLVVAFCWMARFFFTSTVKQSFSSAYSDLPSMHFNEFWAPGIFCGVLSSLGIIASVLATGALGYSVGYPVSHASLLISGLWGIILYKEVKGFWNIMLWFASALVACFGMLLLSREHVK